MIPGGYILLARKTLESELFDKPPLWSKLWNWMLLRAEWREDAKLMRGQFWTNLEAMREAMSWHVGYRKMTPTVKETRSAYEGLRDGEMIGVAKGVQGVLITILNYDKYQSAENYERRDEGRDEGTTKGDERARYSKEVQEEKKNTKGNTPLTPRRRGAVPGAVSYTDSFNEFWGVYPKPVGKDAAFKAWQAIPKKHPGVKPPHIIAAIKAQVAADHFRGRDGEQYFKNPSTWLNQACWADEIKPQAPPGPSQAKSPAAAMADLRGRMVLDLVNGGHGNGDTGSGSLGIGQSLRGLPAGAEEPGGVAPGLGALARRAGGS